MEEIDYKVVNSGKIGKEYMEQNGQGEEIKNGESLDDKIMKDLIEKEL